MKKKKEEENDDVVKKNATENKRTRRIPQRYEDYEMYMTFDALSYVEKVPECVEELKGRDDEQLWKTAMKKAIESLEKNKTWIEVKMPNKAEILKTKWVFASKPLEEKLEDRYKARLVVKGFAQRETFQYDENYSPVAKMSTIRTLLSIGNRNKYYFEQLDVKTAFVE